ncbi:MAG: FCD domain-containing protein [Desulfobacterales bacterium]|nr:FCD domain-containing protein [Desulfobacterales bacterium]
MTINKTTRSSSVIVDVEKLRLQVENRPRNMLLLEFILMTTATIPEILSLKVEDLKEMKAGERLPAYLGTGADPSPVFTTEMKQGFEKLCTKYQPPMEEFLFKSGKGKNALSVTSVSRLVRTWLTQSGMSDRYNGVRGLRSHMGKMLVNPEKSLPQKKNTRPSRGYTLPRVKTKPLHEFVFQELEKAIISGRIPPGQRLATEAIARDMGVSRIPVREALRRLEARGFITTRPNWGSVVNTLSRENLQEILHIRLLLECEAIEKAAVRVKATTISRLKAINAMFARLRVQNDPGKLLAANREFHLMAYRDADSPILLEIINQLWDRVNPYYNIMFRQSIIPHPKAGIDYHAQLIKAMAGRDSEKSKHWIKADLIRSADFVLKLFDLHQEKSWQMD